MFVRFFFHLPHNCFPKITSYYKFVTDWGKTQQTIPFLVTVKPDTSRERERERDRDRDRDRETEREQKK